MKLTLPTWAQVAAFARHIPTYVAGAVTAAVGLHFVTAAQGNDITTAVNAIVSGVESITGGVITLVAIASGLYAAYTASPAKQAAALGANSRTLVNSGPNGTATITVPPEMASAALAAQKKAS
jgi:hypothetical protein